MLAKVKATYKFHTSAGSCIKAVINVVEKELGKSARVALEQELLHVVNNRQAWLGHIQMPMATPLIEENGRN